MKILTLLLLFSFTGLAQDNYSLYFENDEVDGHEKIRTIPEKYFGEFKLVETKTNGLRVAAGDLLKVDLSGVYIEKNRLLNISREEIRENSQYSIKDGWLFGVSEGDSMRVALDGEQYYFLMPVKTYLYEAMSDLNAAYSTASVGEYIVMSELENEYFSSLVIQFNGGGVELKELDYQCKKFDPRKVKEISGKTEEGIGSTHFIDPDENEWKQLISCHFPYDAYER